MKTIEIGVFISLFIFSVSNSWSQDKPSTQDSPSTWSDPYKFPATRNPCLWPFSRNSIWNTPIGSNAKYVSYQSQYPNGQVKTFYLDDDIIILTPKEPMMDIMLNTADWNWGRDRCVVEGGLLFSAPIPKSFLWHRPKTLSNACLAVLMSDGRTIKQTQPFTRCAVDQPALSHYKFEDSDIYGEGITGSHGGSGMSAIGGTIRMGELAPGAPPIHHALKMAVQRHGSGHRWPAPHDDAGSRNIVTTGFCDGALCALLPSFDIAGTGFETEVAKYIARACQDYGIYLVDGTGWSAVCIDVENGAHGWVRDEVLQKWGVEMDYVSTSETPFGRDMKKIFSNLMVVDNNAEDNRGGGGTPRAPIAPPFGPPPDNQPPKALNAEVTAIQAQTTAAVEENGRILTIDFAAEGRPVSPRVGFLGGLRDSTPDEILRPLNISLWRIGHQYRGRISQGLPAAVDRVESLGGVYKLVMSDLVHSQPTDWAIYEADAKKLVKQVGARSSTIIWEPVNEPDISHKPIEKYYELYAHAFKALREADPKAQICGPGFAYPAYDKYRPFLDYCRQNDLECNYLAWHYTGWDAGFPEQAGWQLGKMREFISEYPGQKIKEIHCDEWGAGPDKPGCLHPGRAIIWFNYLENVYQVDRACRANWGKADDYLGGIVTRDHQPHPVYHVYRWYGRTKGQTRVPVQGGGKMLAALASRSPGRTEILLGSIEKNSQRVTLQLKNMPMKSITVRIIPSTDLEGILKEDQIPLAKGCKFERNGNDATLTIGNVEENQAWQIILTE